MSETVGRLRGLVKLVTDAVDGGATAIERVHLATTKRTFDVLEMVPVVNVPSKGIHVVHDASVSSVYGTIRFVNRLVAGGLEAVIDLADRAE